jgi:hypothetical protein
MRIYITYCSHEKNDSLKAKGIEVSPNVLYRSKSRIQPFINRCKQKGVRWAIFSDLYGIWFPEEKHAWYEKAPDDVSETELKGLLRNFDEILDKYEEICFYRPSPVLFHFLYRQLLKETKLTDRIRMITSIYQIG